MKKFLLPVLMLTSASLFSNPLPLGGPGKTIVPYIAKSDNIRLKEEHIIIKVGDKQEVPSFVPDKKMQVKCISFNCTYYLHNSGSAQTINIGFPFYSGSTKEGDSYGSIDNFKVHADDREITSIEHQDSPMKKGIIFRADSNGRIDDTLIRMLLKKKYISEIFGQPELYDISPLGNSVSTIRKKLNAIPYDKTQKALLLDRIKKQVEGGEDSYEMYRTWYYFPVSFKAHTAHKLTINYRSSYGNYEQRSFYYVLRSARLWSGAIDKCLVDIVFLDNNMDKFSIQPKSYRTIKSNTIQFEWNNFIPDQDIFVRFIEYDNN